MGLRSPILGKELEYKMTTRNFNNILEEIKEKYPQYEFKNKSLFHMRNLLNIKCKKCGKERAVYANRARDGQIKDCDCMKKEE